MIVTSCQQMSSMMGEEYDENAELVVKKAVPPTMEQMLASGYEKPVAERIFATEHAKAEQGVEPYGPKPLSEFVQSSANPEPPKPEETVEDVMAAMAKQAEASHAEVLRDADPMGIFATPEPEETAQLEKKRGKAAKE